ncbi:MAG: RdgB/HAM1 family non-canonical purine NTP pyrophosphatase [Geminicoccaceae bacterium]|nr:RdgB/HAM1 family non-canonical purine NTP pyrophosphatase [Geminicoccaceae bacterium]
MTDARSARALRRLDAGPLVLATHNAGKVREFADLLADCGVTVMTAADLALPEPEETGATFHDNARLKARAAAAASGRPALADDSGLAVTALDGAPGVHSARWAGADRDFARAMRRLLDALEASGPAADRSAAFVAVLCLAWPDGHEACFEGRVAGTIAAAPRGDGGFGYDPLFVPHGEQRTFAQMSAAEKRRLSHRARAFEAFARACLDPV